MIDLHCHTIFSDGALLPAELARRVEALGYSYVALTDHVGPSNMEHVIRSAVRAAEELNPHLGCTIIPGVELTHVPPKLIPELARRARELGAAWVVVHGESLVEPVAPGTNRAALETGREGGVDLLAHPGLLTPELARLAARNRVALELTSRRGHSLSNGLVAALAREAGATLLVNSDSHAPGDILTPEMARKVALGAGLSGEEADQARHRALELAALAAGENKWN